MFSTMILNDFGESPILGQGAVREKSKKEKNGDAIGLRSKNTDYVILIRLIERHRGSDTGISLITE